MKKTVMIIVILFLVSCIPLAYYFGTKNVSVTNYNQNDDVQKELSEYDGPSYNLVNKLYEPFTYNTWDIEDEEIYKNDILTSNDLSSKYKKRLALAYFLDDNPNFDFDNNIKSETLESYYVKLFGENSGYVKEDFNSYGIATLDVGYDSKTDSYNFDIAAGDATFEMYDRYLYNTEKKDNKIYLYEYALIASGEYNEDGNLIYTYFANLSDMKLKKNSVYECSYFGLGKNYFEQLKDKINKYKYTFELDKNNNYIFTKIEKIK
ncbi:MAG: hypothetical protein PUD59_01745 [bacterium]|nr:hypothetical protein [bacterium]